MTNIVNPFPEGDAVVYCRGAFNTPVGKTAHGLVRFTRRYRVAAVIDDAWAGRDAGDVLDGRPNGIPVVASLDEALHRFPNRLTHFVVGLAPDGGRLSPDALNQVEKALKTGLNVDCGLHDYLSDNPDLAALAHGNGVGIRDIRKPPPVKDLHFFSGKIEQVAAFKIAVLGTDSAVGKRTTAWLMHDALVRRGVTAEMIGTGQTAWMQGARYSLVLDSLVNDFVSGEIEHAVWSAWNDTRPDVIIIEGQGSLMNPAYPGGFEILAAGRPDVIVLQHAPARAEYDGFPGYPIQPLPHQIHVLESLSGKPVTAVTLNHEDIDRAEIPVICRTMTQTLGIPVVDVLVEGADSLADHLVGIARSYGRGCRGRGDAQGGGSGKAAS